MPTDNNDSETDENHQLESIQSGLALFRMNVSAIFISFLI